MNQPIPKASTVYRGCVLGTIFDALWSLSVGSPERGWNKNVYLYYGGDGTCATLAFAGQSFVAAVYDHESARNPFRMKHPQDVDWFFEGLPASHRHLVAQALYYRSEHLGSKAFLITAAFWDDGEYVSAREPWGDVWRHGASCLQLELIEDLDTAIARFQENYGFDPEQLALGRRIFERKMASRGQLWVLDHREAELLGTWAPNQEALHNVQQNFEAIGIGWPNN